VNATEVEQRGRQGQGQVAQSNSRHGPQARTLRSVPAAAGNREAGRAQPSRRGCETTAAGREASLRTQQGTGSSGRSGDRPMARNRSDRGRLRQQQTASGKEKERRRQAGHCVPTASALPTRPMASHSRRKAQGSSCPARRSTRHVLCIRHTAHNRAQ
jgi:hypothetical protein